MPSAPSSKSRLTVVWQRTAHGLAAADAAGHLSPSLLTGDLALTAGLAYAQTAFLSGRRATAVAVLVPAGTVAVLGWLWRGHDLRGGWPGRQLARAVGVAVAAGAIFILLHAAGAMAAPPGQCLWLAAVAAVLSWSLRVAHLAARAAWPDQPGEVFRWLAVIGATAALVAPFWTADSLGAGDADWYTIMLADFTAQWRAGVFPVWVGQSVYAFNGAVSPLRMAPCFQHWGGVVDLLSAHALGFVALKNATLVMAALAGGLAAYAALRGMLAPRSWLAALLALLWLASPGVLAPLMAGDQYMTFMTLPFVAATLYGIWRLWVHDDNRARLAVAAGLAGLWLSHTPVALWMSLLAGAGYATKTAGSSPGRLEFGRLTAMAAVFFVLGAFPVLSVLALDNLTPSRANGAVVFAEIARVFPANFLPINLHADPLVDYQLGYAAIGAFLLTLLLLGVARARGATVFVLSAVLIAPFTLPLPWLTAALWSHLPVWFVTINNIWPMQRLFLIWTAVIFFGLAASIAPEAVTRRRGLYAGLALALLAGAAWSWHEARALATYLNRTRSPAAAAKLRLDADNFLITRYAYTNFARAPAYFSQGYINPALENRLLARNTYQVLQANADAAAPRLALDDAQAAAGYPRLVQSGVLTAVNDNHTDFYNLSPSIELTPGVSYALRLNFLQTGEPGVLQLIDPRLFREYYLPDSGIQMAVSGTSLAFGSESQSSHIIPLRVTGPGPVIPRLYFITPRRKVAEFPFARFSLFTYDPAQLPVAIESWIPYRARVQTAVPAWLETPRVWQGAWRARVNGQPAIVRRSPQDLAMIPVEPGESEVTLDYVPPWWLRLDYWVTLAGWTTLGLWGAARVGRAAGRASRTA